MAGFFLNSPISDINKMRQRACDLSSVMPENKIVQLSGQRSNLC